MGGLFGGAPSYPTPPAPTPPPPAANPPVLANPSIAAAGAASRSRSAKAAGQGFSDTIATTPQGTDKPTTAYKSLLGE